MINTVASSPNCNEQFFDLLLTDKFLRNILILIFIFPMSSSNLANLMICNRKSGTIPNFSCHSWVLYFGIFLCWAKLLRAILWSCLLKP